MDEAALRASARKLSMWDINAGSIEFYFLKCDKRDKIRSNKLRKEYDMTVVLTSGIIPSSTRREDK